MRLGVSNLLWERDLDRDAAHLLQRRGIDAIDIAPTRYFDRIAEATGADWRAIRRFWQQHGIEVTGMQALLHGTDGLDIFGNDEARRRTGVHLCTILQAAAELGARQLVFGSWRNRRRGTLDLETALARAADFFGPLAAQAASLGVCLSVEPIDAGYGNDFLLDHDEAARLVTLIASAGFGLTLDVGCIVLAGEDVVAVVGRHAALITHVQLAEHQLAPLDAANPIHALAGPVVRDRLAGRVACIEALKPPESTSLQAIEQSLDVAQQYYG